MEFTVAERIVFHDALPNTEGLADVIMYETDNTLIAFARAKVVSILREADWDPIYLPPLKNAEPVNFKEVVASRLQTFPL